MSERRYDELIDSYIKHAGRELLLKLAKEAPSEEELANVCDASDALDRMIMDVIDKEVEKKWLRRILSVAGKAAAIFFIFVTICAFTISYSKELRTQFAGLFIAKNELSFDYNFAKEEDGSLSRSLEIKDNIAPGFLPAGYVFRESSADGISAISRYFNSDGEILTIERSSIGASHGVDYEQSVVYEIDVLGNPAFVLESESANLILFSTDRYEYSIDANLDIDILITIAEGLE